MKTTPNTKITLQKRLGPKEDALKNEDDPKDEDDLTNEEPKN